MPTDEIKGPMTQFEIMAQLQCRIDELFPEPRDAREEGYCEGFMLGAKDAVMSLLGGETPADLRVDPGEFLARVEFVPPSQRRTPLAD